MVRSATEINFIANAISINPRTTFTEDIHPPAVGSEFNQDGKAANSANGKASAVENPSIPISGPTGILPSITGPDPVAVSTSKVPITGPVQENETSASVKAIKNIPSIPPLSACASAFVPHEEGSVISKNPKKDNAKTINRNAKNRLKYTFVDIKFNTLENIMLATMKDSN